MHYLTLVLLNSNIEVSELPTAVATTMASFDDNLDVPHIVATANEVIVDRDQVVAQYPGYAEKYADLDAFVRDWHGLKGLDEHGNAMSTRNPDGKWDWYEIGGRWHGLLTVGERGVASARLQDVDITRLYTGGLLLADGTWVNTDVAVPFSIGLMEPRETNPNEYETRLAEWEGEKQAVWQAKFGHILESAKQQDPQQWLVVVDYHR